ncbi:MAG: betaine/proline/choline family ABC transporter ATP-binding protein [Rhodobacteraceae bacterium]|nr:betaine/proline/choline family ABC transporter ATP-binding protein [Paracoccaceae bacterium]
MPGPVKLSCRHLWKVYGPDPARFFAREGAAPDALAAEMRAAGHIPAAIDVGFDVHVGETFVIMGLSGSGKSTVIRCLSRLIEPEAGQVLLDGQDLLAKSDRDLIEIRRHKMGMVFQNFGLLPHLTVIENISFPLRLQGLSAAEQRDRAAHVIDLVGLKGREQSYPGQLSGGQQQRVGIARSLAVEPELWFLDEPFSALDPLIRRQMQDEFLRIQRVLKKSIVFITHDFLEALRIADRMAIMRDGRVVQIGTPEELILNPADDYVAQFTGEVPRIKILRAHQCAVFMANRPDNLPRIAPEDRIEGLMSKLAASSAGLDVVDSGGAYLGTVTAASLVGTLGRVEGTSPSRVAHG